MRFENAFWTIGAAVFLVLLVAYAIILMYIFPLQARFENTVRMMFVNSIMIGMRFLLCTALICSHLLANILQLCAERAAETEENKEESGTESADQKDNQII